MTDRNVHDVWNTFGNGMVMSAAKAAAAHRKAGAALIMCVAKPGKHLPSRWHVMRETSDPAPEVQ